MKYVFDPNEINHADKKTIAEIGIPAAILMENAASAAVQKIQQIINENCWNKTIDKAKRIVIVAGSGNNGGDAFAVARKLLPYHSISIVWVGDTEKMSSETLQNFRICQNLSMTMYHCINADDIPNIEFYLADVIIDGLIGTGGSGDIRGLIVDVLDCIARCSRSIKISLDTPTGLDSLTGNTHCSTFEASHIITFSGLKTGMIIENGNRFSNNTHIVDIGIPKRIIEETSTGRIIEHQDCIQHLQRNPRSSKFDYGRVCVIAGSRQYRGAAILTANSAMRSGVGFVELITPIPLTASTLLPEIIHTHYDEPNGYFTEQHLENLVQHCSKSDAIVIGPGTGLATQTHTVFNQLLSSIPTHIPIVLDADALSCFHSFQSTQSKERLSNIVLTPHKGEYARLISKQYADLSFGYQLSVDTVAKNFGCTLVVKDVPVLTTDGHTRYWNLLGNSGMATAGSGDILAGVIGSMLARCTPKNIAPVFAAAMGVYLHSLAGDISSEKFSLDGMTASDISEQLRFVFSGM